MTKDDTTVDATPAAGDLAEGDDDGASEYAETTTTTAATVDDDAADAQVVEEEERERPPPRLMITKMVRAEAGCISFVFFPVIICSGG